MPLTLFQREFVDKVMIGLLHYLHYSWLKFMDFYECVFNKITYCLEKLKNDLISNFRSSTERKLEMENKN